MYKRQGATGATGETGATGVTGATGEKGPYSYTHHRAHDTNAPIASSGLTVTTGGG
ncbi:hypothetical protein H8938_18590, partial [Bacillus pumilus]|nr:hypothetical protein [Bacillus pumilus]